MSDLDELEKLAIERIKNFEPPEGYYLAFSGGKDSVVLYDLVKRSGVKYDAHYNVSPLDPPEVLNFIKKHYPEVHWEQSARGFWKTVVKKGLPTRINRWCCEILRESGGVGRKVLTGIRWDESAPRKSRKLVDVCARNRKYTINPILDFTHDHIWEYIKKYDLSYCSLYDEGFRRVGCIMCPLASKKARQREFERYPKIAYLWRRACDQLIEKRLAAGSKSKFKTGQELWDWWWNF